MNQQVVSLPSLKADLLLLHAPAFFDFRERSDIYFPFLGTSGDVPITPLYEYFPVGFKTLKKYLSDRDHQVKIINLSTVLLMFPKINVRTLLESLNVRLIGIDLHWMVHVQGSLAIAELLNEIQLDIPVVFGGVSATYYAEQLIQYPYVDMVMRGYDTHIPIGILLDEMKKNRNYEIVPNLLWKSKDGHVHDNGFSYIPDKFGCGIDWSDQSLDNKTVTLPILEVLSVFNAGCSYNCGWCGGSRDAFQRIFKRKRAMVRKPTGEIRYELDTLKMLPGVDRYHFYSVGSYNNSAKDMDLLLNLISDSKIKSISYEQFHLTPDDVLKKMVRANKRTMITLSPESHDLKVAKLAGRGVYSNEELEGWIKRALDFGINQIDIWYFIGMPEQDEKSVMETVEYCQRLLEKFKGNRVNPMICPMIPYLDPGSTFFENPKKHGYHVYFSTIEEHRLGMERASIINRINYETKWLKRSDLVHVGYKAIRQLMEAKAESGFLPSAWAQKYITKIDDALSFINVVHEVDKLTNEKIREQELSKLKYEILRRNHMIFYSGVMNQAFPLNRQIGGRWFDELGWKPSELETIQMV